MKSMIEKVFSIKALLSLLLVFATTSAWADFAKTNPVTGETENYTWKFVGTDTWDDTQYWQNSDSTPPVGVPEKSGDSSWGGSGDQWLPILFDGNTIQINAWMLVEGWNLRMGLYNGANITLNRLVKLQSGMSTWFTVDENSTLTIAGMNNNKLEGSNPLCLYSARANGITWTPALSNSAIGNGVQMPLHYYLAGDGTVAFKEGITLTSAQVIKRADVTLSEATSSKTVRSKTLVSFASTSTSTFSADAETTIKVKNSDGTALKDVNLTSVTATDTTLTTAGNVGDCELVQTTTGVVLYYVDYAKTYKPSININFTSGTALSTGADVGIGDFAVPGTSWNNLIGNNGSLANLKSVDSEGTATTLAGSSVTISGTRGYWTRSGLDAASDLRQAYIDDADGSAAPQFVVTGIPYYKYKLVLYFSNDTDERPFGHLTVNGTNYKWDSTNNEIVTCTGTSEDVWGSSDSTAYTEGGNYLVFPALDNTDGTLTVIGHRWSGSQRAGLAAVQIIEVKPEAGDGDLVIELSGDRTYTVSEAQNLSGTVYLTGNGTLTLDGSAKIEAATIDVSPNVTLNINSARLDATTFTGGGTVVYDGVVPPTGKGWTESAWTGTVWIKNKSGITGNNNATTGVQPNSLGNSLSKVKFSGVNGWIEAPVTYDPEIVLENAGYDYALQLTDGNSPNNSGYPNRTTNIKKLSGSGTLCRSNTKGAAPALKVYDASGFTGYIDTSSTSGGLIVIFCEDDTEFPADIVAMFIDTGKNKSIYVASGKTVTLDSAATWTAATGFMVEGTLVANGTLASSAAAAVTGSGTVTFGGVPSPVDGENETKWWKNAGWTGTVEIKGASITGTGYAFNDYGNATSTVKLTNCSGWLTGGYTCVPALEIGGTFTWNEGWSGLNNTFKVGTLKGSGTISIPNQGAETAVWQITDNWSGFTGTVVGNNNGARRVLVFGSTLPESVVKGEIYVSKGATLNLDNSSSAWWGVGMGFVVDGTVKATNRSKWGGGTAMTIGDTGVLELTSTTNVNDANYGPGATSADLSGITGTGTLKYSSTAGWRAFPTADDHMPASTLTLQMELADSLIISKDNGATVIGNLAGSKNIRSDFGNNGVNGRILTVTQSKDTEWEGKFVSNRITQFNVVAPAEGTPGTLTLSGTHTETIPMQVNGKVNLTGTWVGATTVAGTFGGTGTLTGNLTFNAGSTFKAYASDENGLSVSGTVAYPAEGTVTVDVSDLTLSSSGTTLITFTSAPLAADVASKMAPSSGAFLKLDGSTLKAYPLVATYGGENYATFADAIAAALADEGGEANLASITVVDTTAELPAGYLIVDNHIVKAQGAIVDTEGVAHYFATPTDAANAVDSYLGVGVQKTYDYFAVYFGTDVEMSVNLGAMAWYAFDVKVKCLNDATVSVVPNSVEYEFSAGTPDESDIVTYTKIEKATTYVWAGTGESPLAWANNNKWKVGTSEGATAARAPSTVDTVVVNGGAPITISGASVATMCVGGAATITGSGTLTATTGGIVLTDSVATLMTAVGVTLSPTPVSGVDLMYVKTTNSEGATTYALQSAGSVVDGVATITDATAEVTVPASATAIEAAPAVSSIKLEAGSEIKKSDITIKYNGTTDITGAFTVTVADNQVTIALNAGGSVTFNEDTEDEETVSVTPTVATTDPMTMAGVTTAPSFNIKTIPGLYYAVKSGTSPNDLSAVSASQEATTTTTEIAGTALGNAETVRYYQISVGRTAAEAAQ